MIAGMAGKTIFTLAGLVMTFGVTLAAPAPVNSLRLRVAALTTLNDLDATAEQLHALHRLSRGAAGTIPAEKIPDAYRSVLAAMIGAFDKNDQAAIDAAQEKIDKVCEDLKIVDEVNIEPTDAARERAERALRQFTPGQIAGYAGEWSEEISSPGDLLSDAMDEVRGKSAAEFGLTRDRTARRVAILIGGVDVKAAKDAREKAAAWLSKVHELSDADFAAKRAELEAEARKMTAQPDPIPTLRHWVTNSMAELLSNPELPAAIETMLRRETK
jgi:hypothetical protein